MAGWLLKAAKMWPRWLASAKDPAAAQAEVWSEISGLMSASSYWPERLGGPVMPPLETLEPTTFDDYQDAIVDSYQHSTTSPLNGEPLVRWIKSSGSSGRLKRFPFTATYLERMYEAANYPLPIVEVLARLRGRPGHHLSIHGMTPTAASPMGVVEGYGSGFDHLEPDLYPPEANASPDPIRTWRPAYCLAHDLHSIVTVTCEPLFVMLNRLEEDRSFYVKVLDGSLPTPEGWAPLTTTPERQAYVKALFASSEPLTLGNVWPNLRLLHTWLASVCGLQAHQITADHPQIRLLDNHYNATEGPLANPIDPDEVGGPIFASGILHEFLEPGAAPVAANVLKAWQLEEGREYEILLTTQMGLVRYRLGDVVRCTGHWHKAPKLAFQRRAKAELSMGAATFAEDELAAALQSVGIPSTVRLTFAPSADGRALTLYTSQPLPPDTVRAIQDAVAAGNDSYAATVEHAWSSRIRHEVLTEDNPYWDRTRAAHDQGKPTVLLHEPPTTT